MFLLPSAPRPTSVGSTETSNTQSQMGSEVGSEGSTTNRTGPYLEGNLKLLATLESPTDVMCCRYSADGSVLAVGLIDGCIKIYSPDTFQLLYSLQDDDTISQRLPVTQIRFRIPQREDKQDSSNILIATYASGDIKVWYYTSGECLHTQNEDRQTLCMALNPTGNHFVTAGSDTKINLYDEHTRKVIRTLEPSDSRDTMDGHHYRVFALKYHHHNDHVFLSGGWDDTVLYWDERTVHAVRRIHGPHICGDALDIDPETDHILTGSWRRSKVLEIWDFATGTKVKEVPEEPMHTSSLYCCQWLGRDSILCGGSDSNMCRIIDRGTLNTTGQLVDLPQGVYCLDNDHSGNNSQIAVGSNKYIYLVKGEKKGSTR
ncbi:hypothetical protein ScPMuIL_005596 [Solemya velum]